MHSYVGMNGFDYKHTKGNCMHIKYRCLKNAMSFNTSFNGKTKWFVITDLFPFKLLTISIKS